MHLGSNNNAFRNLIIIHWELGVSALKIECNVLKY